MISMRTIVLAAVALGGCQRAPPPLLHDSTEARAMLGQRVRIEGMAESAKPAAMVSGARISVYCLDQSIHWPDHVAGKRIRVTGVIEETDEFAAREGPGGIVSAGTNGDDLVIRACDYQLLE
jgi:hypothetical protein